MKHECDWRFEPGDDPCGCPATIVHYEPFTPAGFRIFRCDAHAISDYPRDQVATEALLRGEEVGPERFPKKLRRHRTAHQAQ